MDSNMIFRTVLIILAAFVLFALINYYNTKQQAMTSEKFFQEMAQNNLNNTMSSGPVPQRMAPPPTQPSEQVTATSAPVISSVDTANVVKPSEQMSANNEDYRAVDFTTNPLPGDCFPKDRLTAEDLLPKDAANSKWAQVNPAGQGDVKDQNFLNAGYMIGINTVGSSLKNANLQLRSEPVIPKVAVGPFLNSSYEASDALRRPLEIGGDC